MYLLFQIELLQLTQMLFLGLPYSIDYILNVQDKVCLTIASVSEWHVGGICLGDWSKCKMRWPCLNQYHIACNQAGSVGSTPRIGPAPKHNSSVIVGWIAQYLMKCDGESVQMPNM